MEGRKNLTQMNELDEKLINEKFKGVYSLFETKFDEIKESIDKMASKVDRTNGRVTKLELNHAINSKEHKDLINTLSKISVTMTDIHKKTESLDIEAMRNQREHEAIKEKLTNIDGAIISARKRGIHFWLWLSENKWRLPAIMIIMFLLFDILHKDDILINILTKLFGKL